MSNKLSNLVPLFEALSDENRLKIISYVQKKSLTCKLKKDGECDQACVSTIKKKLKISLPTVSYHIKTLENAGLLNRRKDGRFSYLEINPNNFKSISEFVKIFKI